MLDGRLRCVASMVRDGATLADIGTDHAYLPVYLLQQGVIRSAIAADIGEGPAASARRTVESAAFNDCIDVRVGDGLSVVAPDEVTDIVIAGMGGETIIHILSLAPWTKNEQLRLILQPMTKTVELRSWLFDNGFVMDEERVVCDAHHVYNVMCAHFRGETAPADPLAVYVGALPMNEETRPYFVAQCDHLAKKIDGLTKAGKEEAAAQYVSILSELQKYVK